jgi:putative transposase
MVQRSNGHPVLELSIHIVWFTKCRYPVLEGYFQKRCRLILIQICEAEDIIILKGAVSKDHVQMT